MADVTAPVLTGLSFPLRFDVAQGDLVANFNASAVDSESGIRQVVIWLDRSITTNLGPFSLVGLYGYEDSWTDGQSTTARTISQWNAPGTYSITRVEVNDFAGNSRTYTPAELNSLGFATSFEIYTDGYRPTEGADVLQGSNLGDALYGYGGNDAINGLDGDDTLYGGNGDDILAGGSGGDTYYVDNTGDVVVEIASNTSNPMMPDRVYTSVSYTLSAYVEWLDAIGSASISLTGNTLGNRITGNTGDNWIDGRDGNDGLYGLEGNDTLIGTSGDDHMYGGSGDDTYYVDGIGDYVIEDADAGTDTVWTSLANYNLGWDVERLYAFGSGSGTLSGNRLDNLIHGNTGANKIYGWAGNDALYGDAGRDTLYSDVGNDTLDGGTGNDTLDGGTGNDTLYGGAGNDTLYSGSGKDVFVFDTKPNKKTNRDKIDFNVKGDTIWLDNAIFKKLGMGSEANPGKLNKAFFIKGDKAKDRNDYLIYDNKKGLLLYDADGSGKGAAIEFASTSTNLKMTASDFLII